jgi:succinate dehydrogenase / fumarate reductase cytochrome b subunit
MRSIATHFDRSVLITWLVYPLGILASCFHLANGFWTAAITWGLTISKAGQRRWGYVCAALFALTFIAGMTALISGAALDPARIATMTVVEGQ